MISTKSEEEKALKKIKTIVGSLGENSYLAAAFEGCFEVAEDNIKNDSLCSLKQVAEKEAKDKEYYQKVANELSKEAELEKMKINVLKKQIFNSAELDCLLTCIQDCKDSWIERQKTSEKKIVELAEEPERDAFAQQVSVNRESKRVLEHLTALEEKVRAVIESL